MNALNLFGLVCSCLFLGFVIPLSAADKDDEIKEVETHRLTNQAYMTGFRQFADGSGLKVAEYGKGPVRLFICGKSNIDAEQGNELIKIGEQVMFGLDAWTGKQGMFMPPSKSEAEAYCIVVLESDGVYDNFLEFVRKRGTAKKPEGQEDLTKALKTLIGPRCFFTTAGKFEKLPKHWVAHETASMAVGTYYFERRASVPIWLSVSINAEMERLLCGRVAIFTVSYEKNTSVTEGQNGTGNWARDFSNLIKKGPVHELYTAHQAMTFDLIGMSYNQYIQLWSVGSFIRAATAKGSKKKNKFAQIIKRTANGEVDINVVVDVFGKSNKNMTNAWHAWARGQK